MIDFINDSDITLSITQIEKISSNLTNKDLELMIVDNEIIKHINQEQRDINKPTDVLSFPIDDMPLLGSIVISSNFIEKGAKKFKHSIQDEFTLLFIHGLLHLLKYDHETDNGEMRDKEKKIIQQYNLPSSLIVRTLI